MLETAAEERTATYFERFVDNLGGRLERLYEIKGRLKNYNDRHLMPTPKEIKSSDSSDVKETVSTTTLRLDKKLEYFDSILEGLERELERYEQL